MSTTTLRRSPIHDVLDKLHPTWSQVSGCALAMSFGKPRKEAEAAWDLGLCDLSAMAKFGLVGPGAGAWLQGQGIVLPEKLYACAELAEGSLVVKTGSDEYMIEDSMASQRVASLDQHGNDLPDGVYRKQLQWATFALTGKRYHQVLAQTCGMNMNDVAKNNVVFTRVAGVSCSIMPQDMAGNRGNRGELAGAGEPGGRGELDSQLPVCRIWLDPSYAPYLWETLTQICNTLQGRWVGAEAIYPQHGVNVSQV